MDKVYKKIKINKKIMFFLIGLMIVGIIFGAILPIIMKSDDKTLLFSYISNFFDNINNKNFNIFLNDFLNNFISLALIWFLGISIIGAPVVVFIYFSKAFSVGVVLSTFFLKFGFKGLLINFVYLFPVNIITIFVFLIITCLSISISWKLICAIFKKQNINIGTFIKSYFIFFMIGIVILFLISLYDYFATPHIFKFILGLLKI